MNLVIISRTQSKLDATAKEITDLYPKVQVKTISADFEKTDIYDRIEAELKDLDIGILVNNVAAVLPETLRRLSQIPQDAINRSINCNVLSAIHMSRIVLPGMVTRKRGAIINMSSAAAIFPPIFGLYSASKWFMRQFSNMLRMTYSRRGIIVQEVEPVFVNTKMAVDMLPPLNKFTRMFLSSPEDVTRRSLRTLGRYPETHGTFNHEAQCAILNFIPSLVPTVIKLAFL